MAADLTRIAYDHLNSERLDEAEAAIAQALAQAPNDVDALYVGALIYFKRNDIAKELKCAERLAQLRPKDSRASFKYALALERSGNRQGFAYYQRRAINFVLRDRLFESVKNYKPRTDLVREGSAVMGLATSYAVEQIAPFVLSLRQAGYQGDIVLFIDNDTPEMIGFLRENNVTPVYAQVQSYMDCFVSQSRYPLYYDYLKKCVYAGKVPARVFLTDVRDVFFQANPFDIPASGDVTFFLEDPYQRFGSCPTNSKWMRLAFGQDILNSLAMHRVSCGGTTMGTYDGIMRYLLKMNALISGLEYMARQYVGVDQATHNYIVYRDSEEGWEIRENGEGLMTCWAGAYLVDDQGLVCNLRGEPQAVVHQYDRFADLAKLVEARFSRQMAAGRAVPQT